MEIELLLSFFGHNIMSACGNKITGDVDFGGKDLRVWVKEQLRYNRCRTIALFFPRFSRSLFLKVSQLVERFPVLKERASQFSLQLLREKAVPLREFVSNLVMIEMAYINTSHPDFIHSRLKTGSRLTTSGK